MKFCRLSKGKVPKFSIQFPLNTEFAHYSLQQSALWVNRDSIESFIASVSQDPKINHLLDFFLEGLLIKSSQGKKKLKFIFSQNLGSSYISLGIGCQALKIQFLCKYSQHFLAQIKMIVHEEERKKSQNIELRNNLTCLMQYLKKMNLYHNYLKAESLDCVTKHTRFFWTNEVWEEWRVHRDYL